MGSYSAVASPHPRFVTMCHLKVVQRPSLLDEQVFKRDAPLQCRWKIPEEVSKAACAKPRGLAGTSILHPDGAAKATAFSIRALARRQTHSSNAFAY